jgi:hypothetical protein
MTRAEDNRYCIEIRRYFSWEKERTIKNVMQYYYATLTPSGVFVEAEEIEK